MNLPPDRQGHLRDLHSKTLPELKELLERQEKILQKRAFLEQLPDKGEKTKKFAGYLKTLIHTKSGLDTCKEPLLSAKSHSVADSSHTELSSKDNDVETARVEDARSSSISDSREEELVSRLQNVTLGHPLWSSENTTKNSYERVIKKAEMEDAKKKSKFFTNRPLKSEGVPAEQKGKAKTEKVVEESAVRPPVYEYTESKLISIEESVKLIEEQRIKSEELMAEHAARRLAAQLAPKMKPYTPESIDLRYRNQVTDSDDEAIDSDDDDVDQEEDTDNR